MDKKIFSAHLYLMGLNELNGIFFQMEMGILAANW